MCCGLPSYLLTRVLLVKQWSLGPLSVTLLEHSRSLESGSLAPCSLAQCYPGSYQPRSAAHVDPFEPSLMSTYTVVQSATIAWMWYRKPCRQSHINHPLWVQEGPPANVYLISTSFADLSLLEFKGGGHLLTPIITLCRYLLLITALRSWFVACFRILFFLLSLLFSSAFLCSLLFL